MKCPKCQIENPEGIRFCGDCGAKLQEVCPVCGSPNPLHFKFCGDCGQTLAVEAAATTTEPAPDAERKQITALFLDLTGYTAMTERLDPEDVKEIMSWIFGRVREVVTRYDGFIERFMGDGVLALFGALKAHEDDPVRAIRAAREIHELVDAMNPKYEAKVGAPLSMHSGINTGLAVTADVNPETGTHSVTGDVINIAARLSDLAKAHEILVGPDSYYQTEGHFTFKSLEPVQVKGRGEPISVYKVLAPKERPIKTHRVSGLRADLIGRDAEMARLQEAARELKQGRGSVICVGGDAGTGKSRLIQEFRASLDLKQILWREGHAYPYSQNTPYYPLVDLMNRAWKIEEGAPPEKIRERIESGMERLLGNRDLAPYVGRLYAITYPEIEKVSPEFWRARLWEAMGKIVAALTRIAPTVFCWEDVHWADPSTLDLIRVVLSQLNHPAVTLCVYRLPFTMFTEDQIKSFGEQYQEIRLRDLPPYDTQLMVGSLLKTDSIPTELGLFIQKKVEGNPFYLEEAINSLVESGALVPHNGSWRLTRAISETDIPPTVQGVITGRLDRLEREMKRILQEASVIGRSFFHEILRRITAMQDSLDRCLEGLENLDLVRINTLQPDLEYIFKHALTQEVVYNGLLRKDRHEIHERIGAVMEKLFQDGLCEFYETLAYHFKRGRSTDKAVHYLIKAGEKNLARFALKESHQHFQEAFELVSSKPEKALGDELIMVDVLNAWAFVLYYRGDFGGIYKLFSVHEDLARSLTDKSRVAMFLPWLGWSLWGMERLTEADEYLCQSLKLAEEIQDHKVIGYCCAWLTWNRLSLGRMDEGIEYGRRGQELYRSFKLDPYIYFKSGGGISYASYFKGDRRTTLVAGQDILEFGETHGNLASRSFGYLMLSACSLLYGDPATAIENSERLARESMDLMYYHAGQLVLGMSFVLNGQPDKARAPLEVCINYCRNEVDWVWLATWGELFLAVVWIAEGRMNEGMNRIEELRKQWLRNDRRYFYAVSEYLLGSIYSQIARGEGDLSASTMLKNLGFLLKNVPFAANTAERHYNKAIELAGEIGAKAVVGQAYLDLGRLHTAKRRKQKARECLSKAGELFQECHIETYLRQARQELESLN